jgi:hypothetical protein
MLRFENRTSWSLQETEVNLQKLIGFLNQNKIAYNREIGEYAAFNLEVTALDLPALLSFLAEELHAPRRCLLFPYQTLSVNGEGESELIDYFPEGVTIDDIAQELWKKKTRFPRVTFENKSKTSRKVNREIGGVLE